MESFIWLILAVTISLILVMQKAFGRRKLNELSNRSGVKRFPGPINVPIFGSSLHLMWKIRNMGKLSSFDLINEAKKIWGTPMALEIGTNKAIIIDDLQLVKKIMSSEDWANRLDNNPLWMARTFGQDTGLLTSNGKSWKEMRQYIHKTLTKFGFGRSSSLEMLQEGEILNFFQHLDSKMVNGKGIIEMQGVFNISALNILWSMVAGTRFAYDSEEISKLTELLEEFARAIKPEEMGFVIFSWLRFVPGATGYWTIMENSWKMQEYFRKIINERRSLGTYKMEQNNFIDSFLLEIDYHKDNKIEPNYYTDEQLIMVLVDLFLTGFIPTSSSVEFLIMFMILNPHIQKKCQEEIDSVVGKHRYPSINDTERLPYVQAVCIEVLRKVTFIPLTTRTATRDTFLEGCFVSKDTVAALNLFGVHNDPEKWDKPDEFRPERFLDENGKVANQETILPFGTGKRVCPAEVFARISTFTYFTYLIQRFTFELPLGSPLPDPTPNIGLGNYPKPFKALVVKR